MSNLSFGFSPCPNDTFILDALIHNKIDTRGYQFDWIIEDVEYLNRKAIAGDITISKMSFAAYAQLTDQYQLIPYGSALGKGCGPLLISKNEINDINQINKSSVAIPGKHTTANMLLTLAYPEINMGNKKEMLFSDVEDAVLSGQTDLGLIIHENRFTYKDKGLFKVRDLGDFWEESTGYSIPLGGFAIKREIDAQIKKDISELIKESVAYAFKFPESSQDFIKEHAQEMDSEVINSHIKLYVNEFSIDLGSHGKASIAYLLESAVKSGLTDKIFSPLFT